MTLKERIMNGGLYALSVAILITTFTFVYLLVAPITVIKNWEIVAPPGPHKVGDTIIVESLFDKVADVDGVSHRNLVCSGAIGNAVSYPIDNAEATHAAQNKAGVGIPFTIPKIVTPANCSLHIDIVYKVNSLRSVTVFNKSNNFKVIGE